MHKCGTFWERKAWAARSWLKNWTPLDHRSYGGPAAWLASVAWAARWEQWADKCVFRVFVGVFTSCSEEHMSVSVTACWQQAEDDTCYSVCPSCSVCTHELSPQVRARDFRCTCINIQVKTACVCVCISLVPVRVLVWVSACQLGSPLQSWFMTRVIW